VYAKLQEIKEQGLCEEFSEMAWDNLEFCDVLLTVDYLPKEESEIKLLECLESVKKAEL
jgi:hypothetical protein